MAIENLQKSEGIASHKSSLLNSHVSPSGSVFEKDMRLCEGGAGVKSVADPGGFVFYLNIAPPEIAWVTASIIVSKWFIPDLLSFAVTVKNPFDSAWVLCMYWSPKYLCFKLKEQFTRAQNKQPVRALFDEAALDNLDKFSPSWNGCVPLRQWVCAFTVTNHNGKMLCDVSKF